MSILVGFYEKLSLQAINDSIEATIQLNPKHKIFEGHFPNNPIAPGVCMIQIVKELLQDAYNRAFFMQKGDNIKFMAKINPNIVNELMFSIKTTKKELNVLSVSATIHAQETVYLKFKGEFR